MNRENLVKALSASALLIGNLFLASVASAELSSQEVQDRLVANGAPASGVKRIFDFLDQNVGKQYTQDTYICVDKDPEDVKPCIEKERVYGKSRTVTLKRHQYAVLIDFKMASTEKRFFLLNMENGEVETLLVTHGKGSGEGNYATNFSNVKDSLKTSLGMYIAGEIYKGSYGMSMRMYGLEKSNDQAYVRDIVMHGADYASADFPSRENWKTKKPYGRLGLSWGCPAVSLSNAKRLIPLISEGALIFHDGPSEGSR